MTETIFVFGAGGHAKVVVATLQAQGRKSIQVLDDDPAKWGTRLLGAPVSGPVADSLSDPANRAIAAIGDNRARADLVAGSKCAWTTAIHPAAVVHSSASVEPGTLVCAGAVVQPEARLGRHVIVNTSASIDHDCEIADFAHVAPGVRLAGGVRIGTGAMIGIGSSVTPGVTIGEWTTVGAGAVVIDDLPAGCTAAGVPARVFGDAT